MLCLLAETGNMSHSGLQEKVTTYMDVEPQMIKDR